MVGQKLVGVLYATITGKLMAPHPHRSSLPLPYSGNNADMLYCHTSEQDCADRSGRTAFWWPATPGDKPPSALLH